MPVLSLNKTPLEHSIPLDPLGFSGRIGRMRWLAWKLVLTSIVTLCSLLTLLIIKISPTLGITCAATLALAYVLINLRISAQRLHDLNWSAWMLLLHLVPMANLALYASMAFMPGTSDINRYGPPPAPNSQSVKLLAWIAITLIALSVLALITLFALGLLDAFINAAINNSL